MQYGKTVPAVLAILALCCAPVLQGCGGSDNDCDVTGQWAGTWTFGSLSGSITATLAQDDDDRLAGTIVITGSPCIAGATVTGTISNDIVTIGAVSAGATDRYDYLGTVSSGGTVVTGNWSGTGPCAAGEAGTFILTKQ